MPRRCCGTQDASGGCTLEAPDGRRLVSAAVAFGEPLPPTRRGGHRRGRPERDARRGGIVEVRPGAFGVPLHVPVVRDGRVAYVMTAVLRPQIFEKLIRDQQIPPSWVSGLVDADGRFIARVPPRPVEAWRARLFSQAVATSRGGLVSGRTAEGLDAYTAYVRSELANWSLGVGLPTDVVLAGSKQAAWAMLAGGLLCVAAAIGVAIGIGRRIANPIAALAANADTLDGAAPKVHTDITEVRELVVALERASETMAERHKLIEHERTLLKESDRAEGRVPGDAVARVAQSARRPERARTCSSSRRRAPIRRDPRNR